MSTGRRSPAASAAGAAPAVPSRADALAILSAAGCPDGVIRHAEAVAELALALAAPLGSHVDKALLETGALLHDLGRAETRGLEHVVAGVRLGRRLGLPEAVVGIIQRHVGAGLSATEAVALGLPPDDYLPRSREEKLVAYADNRVIGSRIVDFEESRARFEKMLGPSHPAFQRMMALHEEIASWRENPESGGAPERP